MLRNYILMAIKGIKVETKIVPSFPHFSSGRHESVLEIASFCLSCSMETDIIIIKNGSLASKICQLLSK